MAQSLMMNSDLLGGGGIKPKAPVQDAAPSPVVAPAPTTRKKAAVTPKVETPAAPTPATTTPRTASELLTSTVGKLPKELQLGWSQVSEASQRLKEAQQRQAQLESQQEQDILAGKAAALEESNKQARALYEQARKDRWIEPAFSFEPHSVWNMSKMFSVLATLGVMSGGKGKLSAQQSLAAMTGMLKGQRANDETEYKRQYQSYQTSVAAIRAHNEEVKQDVQDAISLLATDREAAMVKKEMAIRKEGSSSITAAKLEAGDWNGALQNLNAVNTALADIYKQERESADKWEQLRYARGTAENVARIRAAATGQSKDAYGFGDIVATAANEASASLQNLTLMPTTVSTGMFQNRQIDSLFGAPVNALVNKMTSESVQRYNAEVNNLGKFIAQVQKGGRSVTNKDIDTTAEAFRIREGDSPLTALTRLAQARQSLERAIDERIASPRTPPELKELYQKNKDQVVTAIPFTVANINEIANARDKTKTFGQLFVEMGFERVTEDDIAATMSETGLSREEVLSELRSEGYKNLPSK